MLSQQYGALSKIFTNFLLAAPLISSVNAIPTTKRADSCACGFVDDQKNVWRESLVTDFTQSGGAVKALGSDWIVSTENEPQKTGIAIQYAKENVFDHNNALGIQASAFKSGSKAVSSGEIFTKRKDILHGTFRMRAIVPTVPGAVFGFFTYASETQEQDIEFLSSDANFRQQVSYTNQPGNVNGNPDPDAHKEFKVNGADFSGTFSEHRIDWLAGTTNYYYNTAKQASITKNVPTTASEFVLNVWSNGDPQFSKGPPTDSAIATVQYAKLYFNSTSLDENAFSKACSAAGNVKACSV